MSYFLFLFLFLSTLPPCLSLSEVSILGFHFIVFCDTLIPMNSLLSVGKLMGRGGFPPVESGFWNGETREGGIKPKS